MGRVGEKSFWGHFSVKIDEGLKSPSPRGEGGCMRLRHFWEGDPSEWWEQPDLQATVAAQWQAAIQAAPDGSLKQWRRSLAAEYGYTENDMQSPAGRIRVIVDRIQRAKSERARRARARGER